MTVPSQPQALLKAYEAVVRERDRYREALEPFGTMPELTTAQRNRGYVTARLNPAWIDAARAALATPDTPPEPTGRARRVTMDKYRQAARRAATDTPAPTEEN
jgi:hypothetical protein